MSALHEEWFYPIPVGVEEDEGGCGRPGRHHRPSGPVPRRQLQAGETVFVNGGTGGVGSMVAQMAKASGAKRHRHGRFRGEGGAVPKLGLDCVLNYKTDDIAARIKDFTRAGGQRLVRNASRTGLCQDVELLAAAAV